MKLLDHISYDSAKGYDNMEMWCDKWMGKWVKDEESVKEDDNTNFKRVILSGKFAILKNK